IPPPRRSAELPLIVQLLTVSVEWAKPFPAAKQIPPPPGALSPPAVLPLITQLLSVTVSVSLLLFSSSQKLPPPAPGTMPGAHPLLLDSPSIVTVWRRIW